MMTKRLHEVVDMVSLILGDYPIHTKTLQEKNILVINTPIWDFYLLLGSGDQYCLDKIVINNAKLADERIYDKHRINREIFSRFCVINNP